jgi:hypothetical protein
MYVEMLKEWRFHYFNREKLVLKIGAIKKVKKQDNILHIVLHNKSTK